jgi:hypothetical protein
MFRNNRGKFTRPRSELWAMTREKHGQRPLPGDLRSCSQIATSKGLTAIRQRDTIAGNADRQIGGPKESGMNEKPTKGTFLGMSLETQSTIGMIILIAIPAYLIYAFFIYQY